MQGTIQTWKSARGFGFIRLEDGEVLFFHHNVVIATGTGRLVVEEGEEVLVEAQATVEKGRQARRATRVTKPDGGAFKRQPEPKMQKIPKQIKRHQADRHEEATPKRPCTTPVSPPVTDSDLLVQFARAIVTSYVPQPGPVFQGIRRSEPQRGARDSRDKFGIAPPPPPTLYTVSHKVAEARQPALQRTTPHHTQVLPSQSTSTLNLLMYIGAYPTTV